MNSFKKPLFAAAMAIALQALLVAALGSNLNPTDLKIEAGLLIISGLSAEALFSDPAPFSLNQIWWMFGLIFFGITPAIQAGMHRTPWRDGDVLPATMLRANIIIVTCLLLYLILQRLLSGCRSRVMLTAAPQDFFNQKRFYALAALLLSGCGAVLIWLYGFNGLFLRSIAEARALDRNTTLLLLGDKGARGILLALSLLSIHLYLQRKISVVAMAVLLGAVLILAFPLAIPRYLAFTFYGAWLLLFCKSWLSRRRDFFRIGLIAVLLLAAPITAELRYIGTPELGAHLSNPTMLAERTFLKSDFDAYASLCRAMQFTEEGGTTGGRQLAGVALFFIPRKVWPQKPVGSGALMFSKHPLDTEFTNVACTYLAEGWINFGRAGAIIFALLMAWGICRYDARYRAGHNDYLTFFYPAAFGLLMFILRGDLLSSFAYTAGFFITGYVTLLLFRRAGAASVW